MGGADKEKGEGEGESVGEGEGGSEVKEGSKKAGSAGIVVKVSEQPGRSGREDEWTGGRVE